jgi:hypothetical protein
MFTSFAARRFALAVACLVFPAGVLATVPNAGAQDITYNLVNYPTEQNGYSLSGQITTDGTIGPLAGSNVVSWAVEVNGTSSFHDGITEVDGYPLDATPTELRLLGGQTAGDELVLSSQNEMDMLVYTIDYQWASGDCFGSEWCDLNGKTMWDDPLYSEPLPWVIAQTATVPEPSAFALLGTALAALSVVCLRRRART